MRHTPTRNLHTTARDTTLPKFGEYMLYDVAKAYSQALYDLGKGKSADPTTYSADEVQKYFGVITSFHVDVIQD